MCRTESGAQLAFLVCWTLSTPSLSSSHPGQGSTFTVLISLGIGQLGYSDCVEGFFDSCVCVFFNPCVLFSAEKGSIFSLFCHSILLPSVLCSSDTVTSYFPCVKQDTPLFYQLLVLIHIFVLGSWLFAGSQHARIHPHCHDDIQTFSNLSSPGALCCLRMTPLVLMVVPRGREDQIEHLSVRIDGQSEGVWGTQWVTYLCQYSCFQLTSAFRPIFVFSSKSFQVITVTNFITAEWNKRYTNVAIEK